MINSKSKIFVYTAVSVVLLSGISVQAFVDKDLMKSLFEGDTSAPLTSKARSLDHSVLNDFELWNSRVGSPMSDSIIVEKDKYSTAKAPLSSLPAMVQVDAEENVKVNLTAGQIKTYADFSDLSYALVKGNVRLSTELSQQYMAQGWDIKIFSGLSGNLKDKDAKAGYNGQNHDVAGFVAFNRKTGECIVTWHGSQDSNDWANNLSAHSVEARSYGYLFNGKVHSGFNARYQSSKSQVDGIVREFFDSLSEGEKQRFSITDTGHSLGGGMAQLAAIDHATRLGLDLFGGEYANAVGNRVRGYALNAPRAVTEGVDATVLGTHNLICDVVDVDPVSMAGPSATVAKHTREHSWLWTPVLMVAKKLGLVKYAHNEAVAEQYGNFAHLGYLAPESFENVSQMAQEARAEDTVLQAFRKRKGIGLFDRVKENFGPAHRGNFRMVNDDGKKASMCFDPALVDTNPGHIAHRIEQSLKGAKQVESEKKPAQPSTWSSIKSWFGA